MGGRSRFEPSRSLSASAVAPLKPAAGRVLWNPRPLLSRRPGTLIGRVAGAQREANAGRPVPHPTLERPSGVVLTRWDCWNLRSPTPQLRAGGVRISTPVQRTPTGWKRSAPTPATQDPREELGARHLREASEPSLRSFELRSHSRTDPARFAKAPLCLLPSKGRAHARRQQGSEGSGPELRTGGSAAPLPVVRPP